MWKVAGVQMDVRLGEPAVNLAAMRERLQRAAEAGAKVVAFPECALTGYGYKDRASSMAIAETLPGKTSDAIAGDCERFGVFAVVGMLEGALALHGRGPVCRSGRSTVCGT
jgi:predicted amidohydrolase